MYRKTIQAVFCFAVLAASAAAQTTVTNNNDGASGTVPVYSGSATIANSQIQVSGGNVGIGTTNPIYPLQVEQPGVSAAVDVAPGTWATGSTAAYTLGVGTDGLYAHWGSGVSLQTHGGDIYFNIGSTDNPPVEGTNTRLILANNGNVGIGTTNPSQKLEVNGNIAITNGSGGSITFQDGTTQTTAFIPANCGADFAESVDVVGHHDKYGPGDLLVIDPEHPGAFLMADQAYSTMVAGVYSTKPGFVGRLYPATDKRSAGEVPMAMVGRVPTNVTAQNGPIHVGDLLVSSSTPGYAMKGTDRSRMLGAVIGKALGSLDSGTGMIEVLVTLQ